MVITPVVVEHFEAGILILFGTHAKYSSAAGLYPVTFALLLRG